MATLIVWGVSIFFLVSLNAELLEQREVVKKTNDAEGPRGLQWVTIQDWHNMSGSEANNPLIYHWCPPEGKLYDLYQGGPNSCKHFIQVKDNGCWQTGH